jgi:putative DNA primase/helicase
MSNKKKQNHKPAERRHKGTREVSQNAGNGSAALWYTQLGFRTVPLHGIKKKDGSCTCGRSGCGQAGRHPRTVNGVRDATTDPQLVRRWWAKWPKAKIGIALGSNLLALQTADAAARQTLLKKIKANQRLPRTVTVWDHERRTLLFKGDGSHLCSDLADGVRILGEGDFIVAPSSWESTGKRHFEAGLSPEEVEIAQVPNWLPGINAERAKRGISATGDTPQVQPTLVVVPSSEIEPEPIQWIWPSVIARGSVTGLVGHPGLGKSRVAMDIAATISTGRDWPGGVANGNAGDVVILSTEHDAAATVVPQLMAAGADRARIRLVKAVKDDNGLRAFNLALDLDRLEKEYDLGQVKLVIIDPVSASPPNNAGNARSVLARLTAIAEQHQLGVLTIQHLNKSGATRDIIRITGSPEWAAGPRAVFLVTENAGTARRLFLPLKNNLSPDRTGYAFDIVNKIIGNGISTSAVAWSKNPVTISADEALAAAAETSSSGAAIVFLRDILRDGPMDQTEILGLGRTAGYSAKMLRTARENLGATSRKKPGANGKWEWVLSGGAPKLKSLTDDDLAEGDDMRVEAEEENGGSLQRGNKPDDPA